MSDWLQAAGNAQRTGYTADALGAGVTVSWRKVFTPTERVDPQAQATVAGSRVFLGTMGVNGNASKFYALATTTGATASGWSGAKTLDAPARRAAASDGTVVTVVSQAGTVYCFSCADGTDAWSPATVALPGACTAAPLYADGQFIYADSAGYVTSLDPADGSQNWQYRCTSTQAGRAFGVPLLMTPAYYESGADKWAIVPRMDGYLEAVYTSGVNAGTRKWLSTQLAGAALKDYWPVVTGAKVLVRPLHKYQTVNAGTGVPSVAPTIRGVQPASYSTAAPDDQGDKLTDARTTNPSSYYHTLYVLSATTGAWSAADAVIHWHVGITMHGPPPPVAIDGDGHAVIPAEKLGAAPSDAGGWIRIDLATGEKVNAWIGSTASGEYNNDEVMAVSCAGRDTLCFHRMGYGQAQRHGAYDIDTDVWRSFDAGPTSPLLRGNMEHGMTNPPAISGTRVYQQADHQLVCWAT